MGWAPELMYGHRYLPEGASDVPTVLSRAGHVRIGNYLARREHSLYLFGVHVVAGWIWIEFGIETPEVLAGYRSGIDPQQLCPPS
jgi:hypothetical protein